RTSTAPFPHRPRAPHTTARETRREPAELPKTLRSVAAVLFRARKTGPSNPHRYRAEASQSPDGVLRQPTSEPFDLYSSLARLRRRRAPAEHEPHRHFRRGKPSSARFRRPLSSASSDLHRRSTEPV